MDILDSACRFSTFLTNLLSQQRLDREKLVDWCQRQLTVEDYQSFANWQEIIANLDSEAMSSQLRILRRYVVSHIITRDITGKSNLAEVTKTITEFADFAINRVTEFAHAFYIDLYGEPIGSFSNSPQHLSVIAMGKMGGYELNVSSDIDLIFIYPESGETNGKRSKSNQEFFTKVGQKIISLLNDITADGWVFRVDMRLRPHGDSGPLVMNETALEQYLISQGREWERYAWIKARICTSYNNDLESLVRPFVYRKYLDFNAYEAMRELHGQIRTEVAKKNLENNIKLGFGGIREIEFIAQIFQLIRGGRVKSLRLKGTQETLLELERLSLLDKKSVTTLLDAYRFLRNTEHRLQYWDDQQTQTLPENQQQQQILAESMGFNDYASFLDKLNSHRKIVREIFDNVLGDETDTISNNNKFANVWENSDTDVLLNSGFRQPETIIERLEHIRQSKKYLELKLRDRKRFDAIIPHIIEVSSHFQHKNQSLFRLLDFIEGLIRRSSYLALLYEYPESLNRIAQIMSKSSWAGDYLMRHPILLDELLNAQIMDKTSNIDFEKSISQALTDTNENVEDEMDALRHTQHAHIFRLMVQDLFDLWTIESISDELSALADGVLANTLQRVWLHLPKKHIDTPKFAVIAYGKLGGKELGYNSDLDLVYLYDDENEDAFNIYSRLANRLTSWLTTITGAGRLYDVDLRLRPNGEAGSVVSTLESFKRYQYESAWIWEHQALSRARFVCGDEKIGNAFLQIRKDILMTQRNLDDLRKEIIAMREKIITTHAPIETDVKYMRGGVVDVEFIVQYLVLAYSHKYSDLTQNFGNIALLKMAANHGLIDETLSDLSQKAYREYRHIQHNVFLRDEEFSPNENILQQYKTVRQLWNQVFEQNI